MPSPTRSSSSAFQAMYSAVLDLMAKYEEAQAAVLRTFLRRRAVTAWTSRSLMPCARPQWPTAGLRQWALSRAMLSRGRPRGSGRTRRQRRAARVFDPDPDLGSAGASRGRSPRSSSSLSKSLRPARAEVQCSRALVLASIGRVAEAQCARRRESRHDSRGRGHCSHRGGRRNRCALGRSRAAADAVCALEETARTSGSTRHIRRRVSVGADVAPCAADDRGKPRSRRCGDRERRRRGSSCCRWMPH